MSAKTMKKFRKKISDIADDDAIEAATKQARRRWEDVRDTLADRAEDLADVAEDRFEQAKDAAAPKVKQLKKKASKEFGDFDLDRVRGEISAVSSLVGTKVARLGTDLADASRNEADRIIKAIQEQADETRLATVEAERKRRVRALIGWTVFGMVAGAILATKFGPGSTDAETVEGDPVDETSAELDEVRAARESDVTDRY